MLNNSSPVMTMKIFYLTINIQRALYRIKCHIYTSYRMVLPCCIKHISKNEEKTPHMLM